MNNPLLVLHSIGENFRVSQASSPAEEWSHDRLHNFLVANGYTAHDAQACINEAKVADKIQIGLSSAP